MSKVLPALDAVLLRLFGRRSGMMISVPEGMDWLVLRNMADPDLSHPVLRARRWWGLGTVEALEACDRLDLLGVSSDPGAAERALLGAVSLGSELRPLRPDEMSALCEALPPGAWVTGVPVSEET